MTDQDLLAILENGGYVSVPYFDGAKIQIPECHLPPSEALLALKKFLTLTNEQRLADSRHLLAYCQMTIEDVGEEDALEDMDGVAPTGENIWEHVTVTNLFFSKLEAGKYASETTVYVQIEGNVAWEPEHGLQMSWANGSRLVKAGAFDGHPTNGHAFADPSKDQYVFVCYNPKLCTVPNPS